MANIRRLLAFYIFDILYNQLFVNEEILFADIEIISLHLQIIDIYDG